MNNTLGTTSGSGSSYPIHGDNESVFNATEYPTYINGNGYPKDPATLLPFYKWRIVLEDYRIFFHSIHGYLSLLVCIFGIIGNFINMFVFTRKNMITSINALLASLAFADIIVLVSHLFIQTSPPLSYKASVDHSYHLTLLLLILEHTNRVSHVVSVWLTVVVAIWRMYISFPVLTVQYRTVPKAKIAIISTYIACVVIHIPAYVFVEVRLDDYPSDWKIYDIFARDRLFEYWDLYGKIESYLLNLIVKVFPCVLLTGFTIKLVCTMQKDNKKRKKLNSSSSYDNKMDKTTKLLVVILVLFFLNNIPGTMLIAIFIQVRNRWMTLVGFVFNETTMFIVLFNSAGNFIVYWCMNSQFRGTFADHFLKPWKAEECGAQRKHLTRQVRCV